MQYPELSFLSRPPRVVINILDDMIWGHPMKSLTIMKNGTPHTSLVQLSYTLYSPWGPHPTNVSSVHYVVPDEPHMAPTGYMGWII